MVIIPYPGGKEKHKHEIADLICPILDRFSGEYREPFVGGGSVTLEVLRHCPDVGAWINDYYYPLYCLWRAIRDSSEELSARVATFRPSKRFFHEYKRALLNKTVHGVEAGFYKLVVHRLSPSGLGERAGGPRNDVGCRWNAERLIPAIGEACELLQRARITNLDYRKLLDRRGRAAIYFDPPYFGKGDALYVETFSREQHYELARELADTPHDWVLSYDFTQPVPMLYGRWTIARLISTRYSLSQQTKKELLLRRNNIDMPTALYRAASARLVDAAIPYIEAQQEYEVAVRRSERALNRYQKAMPITRSAMAGCKK